MDILLTTYAGYLGLSCLATWWVGRTLRKHGPRLVEGDNREDLKVYRDAYTHLLIVGFFLINFGVISLALRYGDAVRDVQSAVELLSTKVGLVLLVLGVMHFIIIASLAKARNADKHTPPRRRAWGEEPV